MKELNLIFKAIVGSQSYGTATPTSDVDHKGVYMQSVDELISFGYKEQVDVTKDECYYEVRRFLQLLQSANPTVLELLYSPKECIIKTTPQFELIVQNRDKFLTQKCLFSFGGYAIAQIKKARALDKKMNWEQDRIERKTPLDFVYAHEKGKTYLIQDWLKNNNMIQERCGLVGLNHFRDCYALFYDNSEFSDFKEFGKPLNFKGIVIENGNEVRLSAVPKGLYPETVVYFNKEEYSKHCRDYKEYQEWLKNRNTQRYVDNANHNQKIDSKNLLHTRRLLDMAIEIATQKTVNVRRSNADYLLSIRRGEVKLDDIINQAEEDIKGLDKLYKNSGLPADCNKEFINELLLKIRKL